MWLGESELGTSVMSLEVRWTERSNGLLQVKGKGEGCPKHDMVQIIGKFGLKVVLNGMENCKGNGKTVKPLGRSEALDACQDLL